MLCTLHCKRFCRASLLLAVVTVRVGAAAITVVHPSCWGKPEGLKVESGTFQRSGQLYPVEVVSRALAIELAGTVGLDIAAQRPNIIIQKWDRFYVLVRDDWICCNNDLYIACEKYW